MVYVCELLTEEPEGGSAMIPLPTFIRLYEYLAELDCSGRYSYIEEKVEPFLPCVCSDFKTPEPSLEPSVEVKTFSFFPPRVGKQNRSNDANKSFRKKKKKGGENKIVRPVLGDLSARLSIDDSFFSGSRAINGTEKVFPRANRSSALPTSLPPHR